MSWRWSKKSNLILGIIVKIHNYNVKQFPFLNHSAEPQVLQPVMGKNWHITERPQWAYLWYTAIFSWLGILSKSIAKFNPITYIVVEIFYTIYISFFFNDHFINGFYRWIIDFQLFVYTINLLQKKSIQFKNHSSLDCWVCSKYQMQLTGNQV